jgi:hypothetical protein
LRKRRAEKKQVTFGDWQTPNELATAVTAFLVARYGFAPATVVEPTCGTGAFLRAAEGTWPDATLVGFDVNPEYVAQSRRGLEGAHVAALNFFQGNWEAILGDQAGPLLILGNPPWVTSADLGALESKNLPKKSNFKGFSGLEAITGKANFDVSEWMLLRLLAALKGRDFMLAMLCKQVVARRIVEHAASSRLQVRGELRRIDAAAHFGASVDAVLLVVRSVQHAVVEPSWPLFSSLQAKQSEALIGYVNGRLTPQVDLFRRTEVYAGPCDPVWRSGFKHDCSKVLEFRGVSDPVESQAAGLVEMEPDLLFPFMKGSDVANGRWPPTRSVLVPQRKIGDQTRWIEQSLPRTWAYLKKHAEHLDRRKSRIYKGQPQFAVFGVGDYTFAPWKIAIAGLYKRLAFRLIPPFEGRPVVFDDTCYLLPFDEEEDARRALLALETPEATSFFNARVFWDDKRPINKKVLQALSLTRLQTALGLDTRKVDQLGLLSVDGPPNNTGSRL